MQDNIAYNTVELSNLPFGENVYEIPEASKTDQKQIEPSVCNSKKRKIRECCFGLAIVFAIALTVVLFCVQLAYNSSQQQALNKQIDILRLEVSSIQKNVSKLLKSPSNNDTATTITPTTEPATTAIITTLPSETCGGPGWRRVAFININDPNQDCPQGLILIDYCIRSCGRAHTGSVDCSSVTFPVDCEYSQVCGRATAYRWGMNAGFWGYHTYGQNISGLYVGGGLSLTHRSPRTHIWTFASGLFDGTNSDDYPNFRCPCDPGNTYGSPPFVGNDYFCDSVATADNWDVNTPSNSSLKMHCGMVRIF